MKKFKPLNVLTRCAENPLVTAEKVPFESSLPYNAGVTKYQGKYVMMFRNDYGLCKEDFAAFRNGGAWPHRAVNLGLAFSDDGINWDFQPEPCLPPLPLDQEIVSIYDPRLTVIEGKCHLCFAVDTPHGTRNGIAITEDFNSYEVMTLSVPDNRNMVLFPEKINGEYVRLERPFPVYGRPERTEVFDCWLSSSPDLRYWGNHQLLLDADNVSFCNCKIGPAAPPIKTAKGWLTTFHAVWKHDDLELDSWHGDWHKEYLAGIMLLDLDDPSKIIGICQDPILAPEADYELYGFRGGVIFPGGMILEDSGEVKIYYGAADTVECLATAHIDDLLRLCLG